MIILSEGRLSPPGGSFAGRPRQRNPEKNFPSPLHGQVWDESTRVVNPIHVTWGG
jgi:hypothetical protein